MPNPAGLRWLVLLVAIAPVQRLSAIAQDQPAVSKVSNHVQDEAAIRKILADGEAAWNRRDAKAMVAHGTENTDHINVAGKWGTGRDWFEKAMTDFFATPRPTIAQSIEKIRFMIPEVAICVVRYKYRKDTSTWEAISTGVWHRINGDWWIEAFQNTPVQSREQAAAQAARASSPMAQTEPAVITPRNSETDFSQDVTTIRRIVAASVDAWNRRDAKAMVAHMAQDADHINIAGGWSSGRDRFEKALTDFFATHHSTMARSIANIRFITPDVAIVITRNEYADDKATLKSISTSVFHKMDGDWWNEAFQNTYVRPTESSSSATPRD